MFLPYTITLSLITVLPQCLFTLKSLFELLAGIFVESFCSKFIHTLLFEFTKFCSHISPETSELLNYLKKSCVAVLKSKSSCL